MADEEQIRGRRERSAGGSAVEDSPDGLRASSGEPTERPGSSRGAFHHSGRSLWLGGAAYLVMSLAVWWNVWSTHPSSTTICGCGDSSLFSWFLNWPAYAISHGLNPLYSTAMGYPHGVNLLANTGEVGVGLALAPVTWIFGPTATLNVALTLSPFLSALGMYVLLRRWVRWLPAAFFGGLLYGFSPYLLSSLTNAHLMLGMAFVPPLVVACLDEMLVRHRHRPVATGVLLGLLLTVQFFLGTELLVIMLVSMGIGALCMIAYGFRHPARFRAQASGAGRGLVAAAVTTIVLLAYPTWFAFDGPAHLAGSVWGPGDIGSFGGTALGSYFLPASPNPISTALDHQFGGYQAPTFSAQYLGLGLVLVLVVGTAIWRRDRRLWLFGILGAISVPLSFGLRQGSWTPWRLFMVLPEFENIIPMRFLTVTYLAAAVMLALILDHSYAEVSRRVAAASASKAAAQSPPDERSARSWVAPVVGVVVASAALLPIAMFMAPNLPLAARPLDVPTWFEKVAPHIGKDQVLLVFPAAYGLESSMTWQAVAGGDYSMVNEGGPGGALFRAGKERPGQAVLEAVSYRLGPAPLVTTSSIAEVRAALMDWGVTMAVLPDQSTFPTYDRVPSDATTAGLITAATGIGPVHEADAWVWKGIKDVRPPVYPTTVAFSQCTAESPATGATAVETATSCISSSGYRLVGADGGVFDFGGDRFYGSLPGRDVKVDDIVGIAATPNNGGYWLVGADGRVYAFGDAPDLGSLGSSEAVGNIVGMAPTVDGRGYWLVSSTGSVIGFGDAADDGSLAQSEAPLAHIVGLAPTSDGHGYWMVSANGDVFAFGDARLHGSLAGIHGSVEDIVGMTPTRNGDGYWLVGADGQVYAFGNATVEGDAPAQIGRVTAVGLAPDQSEGGYWIGLSDGGNVRTGNAPGVETLAGIHLNEPVVGVSR